MPLSKVIKSDQADKYRIINLEFKELDGPLPESSPRADSFSPAAFFRERTVARKDNFAPSFGQKREKSSKKEEKKEKAPPPLSPEEILAQAEAKAASLVQEAATEAETIREEARKKGRAEGLESGRAELEGLKEDAARRLLGAATAIENTRPQVLQELEQELVQLAVMAASKVVAKELQTNPEVVRSVVLSALKIISQTRSVKIRISPQDLEMIETIQPRIAADYPDLAKIDLIPDKDVSPGGCLVTTESEEIDATMETRIQNLAEAMDGVMKGLSDEH